MIYLGARVGDIRALTCPGLVSSSSRLDRGSFLRLGHCLPSGRKVWISMQCSVPRSVLGGTPCRHSSDRGPLSPIWVPRRKQNPYVR
jgi:hypothetical protein